MLTTFSDSGLGPLTWLGQWNKGMFCTKHVQTIQCEALNVLLWVRLHLCPALQVFPTATVLHPESWNKRETCATDLKPI